MGEKVEAYFFEVNLGDLSRFSEIFKDIFLKSLTPTPNNPPSKNVLHTCPFPSSFLA
jgi:hypothetical protein